jgi:cathepsin L
MIGAIYPLSSGMSIDWRDSGKVSSVKNQGASCNSCYAFVAIADIETSYLLASKNVRLSEQQLIDCSSSYGNNGCLNGFYGFAFEYAKKNPIAE